MGKGRYAGALEHWSPGALEPWSTGALEPWSTGALEPWSTGALEHIVGHRLYLLRTKYIQSTPQPYSWKTCGSCG